MVINYLLTGMILQETTTWHVWNHVLLMEYPTNLNWWTQEFWTINHLPLQK